MLRLVRESAPARELSDWLGRNIGPYVKGLRGALRAVVLSNLFLEKARPVVYFSLHKEGGEELKEELEQLLGAGRVAYFPATVFSHSSKDHLNHENRRARLSALEALSGTNPGVVVAHASVLLEALPDPGAFSTARRTLEANGTEGFEELVATLVEMDFVREDRVEHAGEMAVRGGLVDVFPVSAEQPYRIEFWGDQIESIRVFDATTQRSLQEVPRLEIFPQYSTAPEDGATTSAANILDYLPDNTVVVLDEPERIWESLAPDGDVAEGASASTPANLEARLQGFPLVRLVSVGSHYDNIIDFGATAPEAFHGKVSQLRGVLAQKVSQRSQGRPPVILYSCDNRAQAERVTEVFSEEGIDLSHVEVVPLRLHRGFSFAEKNLTVYTDHEFYGRARRLRLPKRRGAGITPRQLRHLLPGDHVVHVDFGVGTFKGLKKITVQGHERECLQIQYRDGDMVYVRIERMDRVNKFSPKEGVEPRLSKLGSPEWQRLKSKTKKKIKDIAQDLIDTCARRKAREGFAFSGDVLWQRELEVSFPYEDTPDQVAATAEVKADMESTRPMDRLICGDVGFGKTEIAVRAAFKCVLSGKQVALLVPTTILAYQHQNTFRERLQNFPVTVEMLSRFKNKREQKEILAALKTGGIDIVIGTHRLLSKDVEFHDLGLLIVDEEHRFGVTHKERLKRYRATVDVLTLTATPIPRTLQFSLMGARDMTHITTPPKDRLPIITEILPFNPEYIRAAILREIDRDGQIFFVHNRVRSIDRVARMVSELVPEAKCVVAHGQMPEKELERIMLDFVAGKFRILVSTMIIESGLDMPNVNTIVVNRADKMGLAQLYQLRGRVGRSHQRAYAYFIIPPVASLTEEALKRLRAIEEFSEIGSGTQLAMRDLEIRGAGNLLGAEQTGFIDTLGFDLYNKILDEAVQELKMASLPDSAKPPTIETQVEMPYDAFLPEDYVESGAERVHLYRRLTESKRSADLRDIWDELHDRFGRLPQPVQNLLNFVAIRILGQQQGLRLIAIAGDQMTAEFSSTFLDWQGEQIQKRLGSIVANASQPLEFYQNESLGLRLKVPPEEPDTLKAVREFFESIEIDTLATDDFLEEAIDENRYSREESAD